MKQREQIASKADAVEVVKAVDEFVAHLNDDLPLGPTSPLGGEVMPERLKDRPEREIRRLAQIGREILNAPRDERVRVRNEIH